MKRRRLLKRKSRKQSWRSLIWKSILSEDIEWKGKRNQRQLKNWDSPGPLSVAWRTGNRRKRWLARSWRRNLWAYSFVKIYLSPRLDLDSQMFSELGNCEYYVEEQFNYVLQKQKNDNNRSSFMHVNARTLQCNLSGLTNLLANLN